jgi:hypothetical protein
MFASISPRKYVNALHEIAVQGYGHGNGTVAVNRYVSGNPLYGGAARSHLMYRALRRLETEQANRRRLDRNASTGVFSGQGLIEEFAWVFSRIVHHRQALMGNSDFGALIQRADYLQALCDDRVFGVDCVGYVGGYLVASGVDRHYGGYTPESFFYSFHPVQTLDQIQALCVVVITSFSHVQIIDRVVERRRDRVIVDLCQSTSSPEAVGPQCNRGVSITLSSGDYADVDEGRRMMAQHRNTTEGEAGDQLWDRYVAAAGTGANERGFRVWLRSQLMLRDQTTGHVYNRTGRIFRIARNGTPSNGVGGACFIGAKPRLEGVR